MEITKQKLDSKKPHVVVLLDESGSMMMHREAVVSTFNEYVASVQDTAMSVSLYTFDSKGIREKMYKQATRLARTLTLNDYKPDGMTPLYDAMAKVMSEFDNKGDTQVQFVVHTDGIENYSKEWTFDKLQEYIEQLTKKGWLFVYLGEGLEGRESMKDFKGLKMNFDSHNRGAAMRSVAGSTQTYADLGSNIASDYTEDGSDTINVP